MTSPAQKAADTILKQLDEYAVHFDDDEVHQLRGELTSFVQQAITEAVDAAVALERAKYLKLAEEWREKYPGDHFIVKGAVVERLALELKSLAKEQK